jgi:hypothetical protein
MLQQKVLGSAKELVCFKALADAIEGREGYDPANFTVDIAHLTAALDQMSALQESQPNISSYPLNPGVFRDVPAARQRLYAALVKRLSSDQFDDVKILALVVKGVRPELLVTKTAWGLTTHSRATEIALGDIQYQTPTRTGKAMDRSWTCEAGDRPADLLERPPKRTWGERLTWGYLLRLLMELFRFRRS